jgi:outer membrane lipopolysaccharide assembly protein LptE/RlpB
MITRTLRWLRVVVTLALVAGTPGCGYSLAGRGSFLPAYIKVIGVPTFTNLSSVFNVEQRITEKVRAELIGRGKYKVVPESTGVDGVLSGEIQSITLTPAAFTDQRQASRYMLTLSAKIEFRDVKADKVLWSNPSMQFREEFDVTNTASAVDPNAFFGQDAAALDRVATEFARSVVSAILEAF